MAIVSFPCTMFNRSGDSEHHYFVPNLREKLINNSPLSMIIAIKFRQILRLMKSFNHAEFSQYFIKCFLLLLTLSCSFYSLFC